MDEHLIKLMEIEATLVTELQALPQFRKLESIRKTIGEFQSMSGTVKAPDLPLIKNNSIATYDPCTMTWRDRVMYLLNRDGDLPISVIIKSIDKLEPSHGKDFLNKRIAVTVSQMKSKGEIIAYRKDGRFVYQAKKSA